MSEHAVVTLGRIEAWREAREEQDDDAHVLWEDRTWSEETP